MKWLAGAIVAALLMAGCTTGNVGSDGELLDVAGGASLGDAAPWSLQLCDHGYMVVGDTPPADRACDFRVTKPLDDPARFDWTTQHGPANEVSMAVNPTDPLNLIGGAKDYTVSYISDEAGCGEYTVWMGQFWSRDGGRTWGNDLIPGFPGDERESPLRGNLCNTDPVMVFDRDGTAWFNALNYRGAREDVGDPMNPAGNGGLVTGSQVYFARSEDGGETYPDIFFASYGQNDPGIFNDKNWLAVDPDSDHMIHTWTNFYGAAPVIEFTESFDEGETWSHPAPLTPGGDPEDPSAPIVPSGQFSMPQYLSNGNVAVIWSSLTGGVVYTEGVPFPTLGTQFRATTRAFSYPDGGLGAAGCLAEADFRASVYPVLAIGQGDRRFVAFPASGDDGTGIWVAHSDDGLDWTDPVEITAGLPDDQFMSWIDVGPDGTVHVAYYDCAAGGAGDETMSIGWMHSTDNGVTWSEPVIVGMVPFDGDLGHHQSGAPFIGDYIAVDASHRGVHFFWADTRHGRSDVYAATIVKDSSDATLYAPELSPSPQGS